MGANNRWEHFDVNEADPDESRMRKWLPIGGAVALVFVLGGAGAALIKLMSGTSAPQQPMVQQISIIQPPPPPPPPEIEQPEPEMEELELDEPEPEPLADDSADMDEPLGEELGLDADGVAGADGFGLLAKKGGRSLLGGGDPHAWYAGILQRDLQAALADDDTVRGAGDYSVVISIWLTDDGFVQSSELLSSTNNPQVDAALRSVLSAGVQISREPPQDLPQPIRLRITSRT